MYWRTAFSFNVKFLLDWRLLWNLCNLWEFLTEPHDSMRLSLGTAGIQHTFLYIYKTGYIRNACKFLVTEKFPTLPLTVLQFWCNKTWIFYSLTEGEKYYLHFSLGMWCSWLDTSWSHIFFALICATSVENHWVTNDDGRGSHHILFSISIFLIFHVHFQ
jgi:hypothetical protein